MLFPNLLAAACSLIAQPAADGLTQAASHAVLAQPTAERHADTASPMAAFTRLIPGEWRIGTSLFHTWYWGPGKHSVRVMTDGFGADGLPWRAVQVFYWHAGRKEIRLLGVNPYARSVAEGTIRIGGDTAEATVEMHQTADRRELVVRWSFEGDDKYHEVLLERLGPDNLVLLAEWDHIRVQAPGEPRILGDEGIQLAERLQPFAPIVTGPWEAEGAWTSGETLRVRSTVQWVPGADMVYARSETLSQDGQARHGLDTYLYHHTGAGTLRCLVVSDQGGVYEGDVRVLDGGALQCDLTGSEPDGTVQLVVRLDFDGGNSLRQRVWSTRDGQQTLVLDIHHRKPSPESE